MSSSNVPLVTPVVLTQVYLDWGVAQGIGSASLTSPTGNAGGNLPIETNPVTGLGLVYGEPLSIDLTASLSGAEAANPFSGFLTPDGFDAAALNDFQFGVLLEPVPAPVPEPFSLALSGSGMAGLSLIRHRHRR